MSEEEKLGKRLYIMMFIMFLIFLAAVLITCVFYSPKTFTPKISESEPEEEFVLQSEISEEDDSVFPIKINTASSEELQLIPNIGPSTAKLILDYRNEYGTIISFRELLSIDGIGEKTVEILEEYCVIN